MPKKGNPADYNSSIFSPRLPPLRPKIFKENRLQLYEIIKDAEKGRRMDCVIYCDFKFVFTNVCKETLSDFTKVYLPDKKESVAS